MKTAARQVDRDLISSRVSNVNRAVELRCLSCLCLTERRVGRGKQTNAGEIVCVCVEINVEKQVNFSILLTVTMIYQFPAH